MSAQFRLAIDPQVVGVQFGLFIVNMAIVKKFYVEPYLRLRHKRDVLTTGSQADATRLLFECDEIARKVQDTIEEAAAVAASERERVKSAAMQKRMEIIRSAEQKARSEFDTIASRVKAEVEEQRSLLPKVVAGLTAEFYAAMTGNA